MRWRSAWLLSIPLVFALFAGCGGGGRDLPLKADAYLSKTVGGEPVNGKSVFAGSIGDALAGDGVKFAAGAVGEPSADDPAPALVLVSITGEPGDVKRSVAALSTGVPGKIGNSAKTRVHGATVQQVIVDQGGREIALAHAEPRSGVLLVVVSFDGSLETSADGIASMLDSAASSG